MNNLELILENIRLKYINALLLEATTEDEIVRGVNLINESRQLLAGNLMEEGVLDFFKPKPIDPKILGFHPDMKSFIDKVSKDSDLKTSTFEFDKEKNMVKLNIDDEHDYYCDKSGNVWFGYKKYNIFKPATKHNFNWSTSSTKITPDTLQLRDLYNIYMGSDAK